MQYISNELGQYFYQGSQKITVKATGSVFFVSKEMKIVKAYKAKGTKPFINYRYDSLEYMLKRVEEMIASEVKKHADKLERKDKKAESIKKFRDELQVGTILYTSWGYEQTNVSFYQVISVKGAFCEVREVAQMSHDLTDMSGKVVPKPNSFIGEPIRKKILDGYIKISSCEYASPLAYETLPTGTKIYKGCYTSSYY
ncbi:hypothetical protein [Acinetobacter calcoaceticus]|uniref:hypothetical protein n=1 Tax=Acinetobacter calcoaceticus TaxID=471 RepID=UPI00124F4F1E|nr:hypothetical protein [Acinetobacter calcoaceticus]